MTTTETRVKLDQYDRDIQGIYELLTGLAATQRRQGHQLEDIAITQAGLAGYIEGHDRNLKEINTKLDTLETRFGAMETKLDLVVDLLRAQSVQPKTDSKD